MAKKKKKKAKKKKKKAAKKAAKKVIPRAEITRKTLKKIRIGTSNNSGEVDARKRYKVKIDGAWYEGRFTKEWFGWNFDDYGTGGMQFNLLDAVFEIQMPKPKRLRGMGPRRG